MYKMDDDKVITLLLYEKLMKRICFVMFLLFFSYFSFLFSSSPVADEVLQSIRANA